MAGYWGVGLGSGILFCFPLGYGADGLWWGMISGVVFSNVLMYWRFTQRLADARASLNVV
jgi:MATE family multidrug resistance protein